MSQTLSIISLTISGLAFLVSFGTLWRTQLEPFRIILSCGSMSMRIQIMPAVPPRKGRTICPVFSVSLSFTNAGARIGQVLNIRARVRYPTVKIKDANELLFCQGEFDALIFDRVSKERQAMFTEAKLADLAPFVVLPRSTVIKFLVFDTFWTEPVRQEKILVEVEMITDHDKNWRVVGTWDYQIDDNLWGRLEAGNSACNSVPDARMKQLWEQQPANLYDHISSPGVEVGRWKEIGSSENRSSAHEA